MIPVTPTICYSSAVHGAIGGAIVVKNVRHLTLKSQPVDSMIARLDLPLAARVADLDVTSDAAEWLNLPLWQLHSQAMLLNRIAVELSKLQPMEFTSILAEQRSDLGKMRAAAVMALFEGWLLSAKASHVNALECVRSFLRIFYATEMLIVRASLF